MKHPGPRAYRHMPICLLALTCAAAGPAPHTRARFPQPPAARPELVLQLGHQGEIDSIAFTPSGKTLISAGSTVTYWNVRTREVERNIPGAAGVAGERRTMALSRDG